MHKNRLEAFSDGVLAIVLTIMVLELKVPRHDPGLAALRDLVPVFLSYLLSFVYIGIYWNNHHHLLQAAQKVNGTVLWANLHLLFWLSLLPFVTGWLGESGIRPWPVAAYNLVLLLAATAYFLLARALVAHHGRDSALARAMGERASADRKGLVSVVIYAAALPLAFLAPVLGVLLAVAVALMWLVPDRRIERNLES
ncbi:MAG TPA: TMEM175 family protein [Holophagaceae bacterium]|nr:TMEM175 family protein [Holophagaceae bacterium]